MDRRELILFCLGLTTGISLATIATSFFVPSTSSYSSTSPPVMSPNENNHSTVNGLPTTRRKSTTTTTTPVSSLSPSFHEIEAAWTVLPSKLEEISSHFIQELVKGLAADGHDIKAIPSYVTRRPTGTETGCYFALDFGGSNFRVCQVILLGAGNTAVKQQKDAISDHLKAGTAEELFNFFAERTRDFLSKHGLGNGGGAKMGFTFSYPVTQTALNHGSLMHWNKGFTTSGVIGVDAVDLLQTAFHKQGLDLHVSALVNDTVGTLIAHTYQGPDTYIGVILGTGSNAAYVECIDNIPKWHGPRPPTEQMIINCEWGAFDCARRILPVTKYDNIVDAASPNPNMQIFEKMMSGKYLGELTRLVMLDLVEKGELFGGEASTELNSTYSFDTSYMSRIERDVSPELAETETILNVVMHIRESTLNDRMIVKRLCYLVGRRSARLASAGIAGLVKKINKLDGCTVAIDGSLFVQYPRYANRMRGALQELLGADAENISLDQARDGSGIGAALIAALADV
ncbi:hexokinase [Synchytrium microbalum]|uniref:Phosphotransferase n=1 Tax=Synchytrium microbalum TaxID=1806994 RepID=A0A507C2J1_9FUNG|nr:hexokinase [Synchytrium microbalum]TPX33641.1 hexokinase [Synchytrium microbalum]